MRVHCFQHIAFEGLGSIGPWLMAAGHSLSTTKFFESHDLPDPDSFDFLIVLGGPMSVGESQIYPWLGPEKSFIKEVIARGKRVLGICLGAQLIANALGARVYRNREKEIGWFPITGVPSDTGNAYEFPPSLNAFHWHGDTFDIPIGAQRIAGSVVCSNQAFQLGKNVLGLQFHLETTVESARELIKHCAHELVAGAYIQSAETLITVDVEQYALLNQSMNQVLQYLERQA
jgi:GMP synthase-like glutamine amidotransferase